MHEHEFTCNVPDNMNRHDPITESLLTIAFYLHKNNIFTKRYDETNASDAEHLNQTGFKIPITFNNRGDAELPYNKTRKQIQQIIIQHITSNENNYPLFYLKNVGVNMENTENVNAIVDYKTLKRLHRNRNKKKEMHIFLNVNNFILVSKKLINKFLSARMQL